MSYGPSIDDTAKMIYLTDFVHVQRKSLYYSFEFYLKIKLNVKLQLNQMRYTNWEVNEWIKIFKKNSNQSHYIYWNWFILSWI